MYSKTDLAAVQKARLDLITGKKAVEVSIAGRRVRFADVNMNDLKSLEKEIKHSLGTGKKKFSYLITTKGL
ncbi:hypothetical protein JK628_02965 [Shewanella sp. KX20019]|uniref:gpW family head-tail joining protein n=1 Tax=Shewanella sp. KX20019 TaxID=2803864 RepID=UPI001926F06C|nr:gpW family head-tail joining protein [Shewanella sp. KX20019]QQX80851.1 hypothetical protein JK628_02965 [Shewanella sp. KX20019]